MRLQSFAIVAAAFAAAGLAAAIPAAADGMRSAKSKPAKHVKARPATVRYVRGLWPGGPDPYEYSYERRGYYPYYDSAYWVPRKQMKHRFRYPFRIPEYASSWGYPLTCKIQRRKGCGVAFQAPAGDPRHYYHPRGITTSLRQQY